MSVENPLEERGPGSNQYQNKPPRKQNQDTIDRNNNKAFQAKNGVGQLVENETLTKQTNWEEEYQRLARKQARLSAEVTKISNQLRDEDPTSDSYYDNLDKLDEMERELEIANQDVYEASLKAEGLTTTDVAAGIPQNINEHYFVLDEALETLNRPDLPYEQLNETLQYAEGSLVAMRRDALFLNRQGAIKGADINEFCEATNLYASQISRIAKTSDTINPDVAAEQIRAIQENVSKLSATATRISKQAK